MISLFDILAFFGCSLAVCAVHGEWWHRQQAAGLSHWSPGVGSEFTQTSGGRRCAVWPRHWLSRDLWPRLRVSRDGQTTNHSRATVNRETQTGWYGEILFWVYKLLSWVLMCFPIIYFGSAFFIYIIFSFKLFYSFYLFLFFIWSLGLLCCTCSAVWSPSRQIQAADGTSLNLLFMWWFGLLCPVLNLNKITWSSLLRRW